MKQTITLPTSPERQTALENKGWSVVATPPYETWDCGAVQVILSADGDHRITDLFRGLSKPGVLSRLLEFAAILGIGALPGYRLIEEGELEHIRNLLEEAGSKRQYDPSWIRPRLLSAVEALDRIAQAKYLVEAIAAPRPATIPPRPAEDGGPSPSPLALLEVLYNCAVNDSRLSPEVERQIRRVLGVDNVVGPGEEETP